MLLTLSHAGVGYVNATPEQLQAAGVPASAWLKPMLKAYAADKRWRIEIGGIVVNGAPVPTDDRAKALLTGAAASMTSTETTKVKVGGAFVDMTGTQVKALRDAVADHVQACFQAEADVVAEIDAGTITTLAEVDAFAWPANA
ncbi:MAG TPA: DUF4376 domain-containing protein [Hyphomicrobiaceae bacterium]|nr:DUF4376 domain-containing protein [Hyphomicrobiaceae bacterium]